MDKTVKVCIFYVYVFQAKLMLIDIFSTILKSFNKKRKAFLNLSCKTGEGEERSHRIMTGLEQMLYSGRLKELDLFSSSNASIVDLTVE